MPWGLRRFQETGQLHFLTFSCYERRPNFRNAPSRTTFETSLEGVRRRYGLCVYGYVVMPEHIHMLVNEPEQGSLSRVTSAAKILHRPSTFGKVKIPALSQKTRQGRGTRGVEMRERPVLQAAAV